MLHAGPEKLAEDARKLYAEIEFAVSGDASHGVGEERGCKRRRDTNENKDKRREHPPGVLKYSGQR